MAVAILALVVALSSSATAALMITGGQIKNGTVTGKDIKDKTVTGKDIKKKTIGKKHLKKNSVTTKQVKDGSLTGVDIKDHSLTGSDVTFGSITGEHLKDGTITTTDLSKNTLEVLGGGASGFEVVTAASAAGVLLVSRQVNASCPTGKVAISGNAYSDGPADIAAPEVRRTGPGSFTAQDSFPLAVVGAGSIQLQVTCLTAG
jgi:hypothetical protein